ncbi:hypothetical protein M9H77_03219 [Catharanthus roseus]|uniref:Uncharacterized protein n=1 Tax=Catharanthus roseus TaxID=4058 RepID=A0ACC0CAN9_CATRO|nr:hypothetical protein M9H77_03219 [Catharanthus roseus]
MTTLAIFWKIGQYFFIKQREAKDILIEPLNGARLKRNKFEEFEGQGKASKLFTNLWEKRHPTADDSPAPIAISRLLLSKARKFSCLPPTVGSPYCRW